LISTRLAPKMDIDISLLILLKPCPNESRVK
jgi:hypothetical protein